MQIIVVPPHDVQKYLPPLSRVLYNCVQAGANIGFILPFSETDSQTFWQEKVRPLVEGGKHLLIVAEDNGKIVGSVQLGMDSPPNQPHRADVTKLIVDPAHRRKGLARALLSELENQAAAHNRTLLTMDTRTGDTAEPLYLSLGYQVVGQIPDFCLDPKEDRLYPTTVMYKTL